MKYEIGDKVKIRDDLNDTEEYWMESGTSSNHANDDMVRLKSKIRTIVDIDGGQYKLAGNDWHWTDEMFEGKITICKLPAFSFKLEKDDEDKITVDWWREYKWKDEKVEDMAALHIRNCIKKLEQMPNSNRLDDGRTVKTWIEILNNELKFRKQQLDEAKKVKEQHLRKKLESLYKSVTYGAFGDQRQGKTKIMDTILKENKENKEDIEMSNTDLIENKLEKELSGLREAKAKEIKDKFYETPIGKAAKAFNEALNQYGNDDQKDCDIDEDQLMELGEEKFIEEINAKYDVKCEEVKEYYAEAMSLFENADTYEQKHEILTSYGILKGPKVKAKVEVK